MGTKPLQAFDDNGNPIAGDVKPPTPFNEDGYPVGDVAGPAKARMAARKLQPTATGPGAMQRFFQGAGVPPSMEEAFKAVGTGVAMAATAGTAPAMGQLWSAAGDASQGKYSDAINRLNPVAPLMENIGSGNYAGAAGQIAPMAIGPAVSKIAPRMGFTDYHGITSTPRDTITPITGPKAPPGLAGKVGGALWDLVPIPKVLKAASRFLPEKGSIRGYNYSEPFNQPPSPFDTTAPAKAPKGKQPTFGVASEGLGDQSLRNLDTGQLPPIPGAERPPMPVNAQPQPQGPNLPNIWNSVYPENAPRAAVGVAPPQNLLASPNTQATPAGPGGAVTLETVSGNKVLGPPTKPAGYSGTDFPMQPTNAPVAAGPATGGSLPVNGPDAVAAAQNWAGVAGSDTFPGKAAPADANAAYGNSPKPQPFVNPPSAAKKISGDPERLAARFEPGSVQGPPTTRVPIPESQKGAAQSLVDGMPPTTTIEVPKAHVSAFKKIIKALTENGEAGAELEMSLGDDLPGELSPNTRLKDHRTTQQAKKLRDKTPPAGGGGTKVPK